MLKYFNRLKTKSIYNKKSFILRYILFFSFLLIISSIWFIYRTYQEELSLLLIEKNEEIDLLTSIITDYGLKGQDYNSFLEKWTRTRSDVKSITLLSLDDNIHKIYENPKNVKFDIIIRKNISLGSVDKLILEAKVYLGKHQSQLVLMGLQFFLTALLLILIFSLIIFRIIYTYMINPLQKEIEKEYNINKSIIDNLHLGISLLDSEMNIIKANKNIQDWYGDRFIGKKSHKCTSCINPQLENTCDDCPMIKSIRDGKVHEANRTVIINGEIKYHRIMSFPIFFEDRINAVIEIVEDVTNKIIDEEKFRRSYRIQKILTLCTQSLIHSSKEEVLLQRICHIIVDSGFYKLAWIGFCQAGEKYILPVAQAGFDEGFLSTGKIFCDVSDSGSWPVAMAIKNNLTQVIHDVEYESYDHLWTHIAMGKGFNSMISIPLRMEGKVLGTLNVFAEQKYAFDEEEISLLEKLADELSFGIQTFRAMSVSQKLIEVNKELKNDKDLADIANRQKTEFLAIISHEIRTPLTGILGMTELLSQSSLNKEQEKYLNIIKSTANLQLSIINDLLDLSKIENGKLILDKSEFRLSDVIEDVTRSFQWQIQSKHLSMSIKIEEDIPEFFIGDPLRIKQIFYNLVGNAIKFTEHGYVNIKVEKKFMDSAICKLKFSIIDSGIGIPLDKQSSIFESYMQADVSITKEYGGTGLGTTICKKLVELMGGTIGLHSPLVSKSSLTEGITGPGSEFWFILELVIAGTIIETAKPSNRIPKKKKKTGLSNKKKIPRERILVVEDNEVNQTLVRIILEKMNYTVDIAKNGMVALRMIENTTYSLIFMDIEMPEMGGIETVNLLRKDKKVDIPIIALTANTLINDLKTYLQSGMNDFLIKPFKQSELTRITEKWLRKTEDTI